MKTEVNSTALVEWVPSNPTGGKGDFRLTKPMVFVPEFRLDEDATHIVGKFSDLKVTTGVKNDVPVKIRRNIVVKGNRFPIKVRAILPKDYILDESETAFFEMLTDPCGFCKTGSAGLPETLVENCFKHFRCMRCNGFSALDSAPKYVVCHCTAGFQRQTTIVPKLHGETAGHSKGSNGICWWFGQGKCSRGAGCRYEHVSGVQPAIKNIKSDKKYENLTYTVSSMGDSSSSSSVSANPKGGPVTREIKQKRSLGDLAVDKATRDLEQFHFGEYVAPHSPTYGFTDTTHPLSPSYGRGKEYSAKHPKVEFEFKGDFDVGSTSPTEAMDKLNFPFDTDGKYFTVTAKEPETKIVPDLPLGGLGAPSTLDQANLVSSFQALTVVPPVMFEHKHALVPQGGQLPVPHQIVAAPPAPVGPIPGPVNLMAINEPAGDYSNLNFQFVSRRYPPGRNENIGWVHWILEKFGVDIYVRVISAYSYAVAARGEDLRSSFASTTKLDHKDPLYAVVQYSETTGFDILGLKFFFPWVNFSRSVVVSYEAFTQLSQGPSFAIGMDDGTAFLAAARSDRCTNNINLNRYSSTSIKHWTSILAFKRFSSVLSEFDNVTLPSVPLNLDYSSTGTTSPRLMDPSLMDRGKTLKFVIRVLKICAGFQLGYLLVSMLLVPLGRNLIQLAASISRQALLAAADATCPQSIKYCYRGLKYLWQVGSGLISRP